MDGAPKSIVANSTKHTHSQGEKLTWTLIKIFSKASGTELKGQARQTFAKLTDDDVERMSGKMEEFSGVLQQRYGYTKIDADKAIDAWVKEADKEICTRCTVLNSGRRWHPIHKSTHNGSARCRAILYERFDGGLSERV